jgi:hypothetical protein
MVVVPCLNFVASPRSCWRSCGSGVLCSEGKIRIKYPADEVADFFAAIARVYRFESFEPREFTKPVNTSQI